jgi:hypothetical protein
MVYCSRYLISVHIGGPFLCTSADDGDKLCLHHHTVLNYNSYANPELLSGHISVAGQHFLYVFNMVTRSFVTVGWPYCPTWTKWGLP